MRDVLRFLFPATDAARIDPATVVVQDEPYAAAPAADAVYPQSIDITFSLNAGETSGPQVRPLFPGSMTFLADAGAPGTIPEPGDVALTEAAYATWKTRGTLMVALCKPSDLVAFGDQFGAIEVMPTVVWYQGIVLTKNFLFTTLLTVLDKVDVCERADRAAVAPTHADWPKHAISGFLKGRYRPKLGIAPFAGCAGAS